MAIEVALEDDLFFADLNRQISLLIDDDDDDFPVANFSSITPQVFSGRMIHNPPLIPSSQYMYQESHMRDMCKGTGVFIPQSSQPRRKYKQGKRSTSQSYNAKFNNNKQLNSSKGRTNNNVTPQFNMFPPGYDTGMISRY